MTYLKIGLIYLVVKITIKRKQGSKAEETLYEQLNMNECLCMSGSLNKRAKNVKRQKEK